MKLSKNIVCNFNIDKDVSILIKGVAIVFVVLGHILGQVFGLINEHIALLLGTGGVNIFLFLSGYGLFESYRTKGLSIKKFWNSKIKKIFIPYFVVTVIYYTYMTLIGVQPNSIKLLENILCIDYERSIDGTMWFMSYIVILYTLFYLVFYFDYKMIYKVAIMFLFASVFSGYWLSELFKDCAWQFSMNAYSFPYGILVAYLMNIANMYIRDEKKLLIKKWFVISLLPLSLLIFVFGNMGLINISYWQYGLLEFIILYCLLRTIKLKYNVLKTIGDNSFLIYLIEAKVIAVFSNFNVVAAGISLYLVLYIFVLGICIYVLNKILRTGSILKEVS